MNQTDSLMCRKVKEHKWLHLLWLLIQTSVTYMELECSVVMGEKVSSISEELIKP